MDYFVHESSYVDEGAQIGEGTKIWHFCHIQKAVIGKNCSFGQNVYIGNDVKLGNNIKTQNNITIPPGVEFEDNVFCGPCVSFTNDLTPRAKYPKGKENLIKTFVKEGASFGSLVTVVCGYTIGRHAMIAAGAVVASDVPDYALMAGVPAKQIGWVCECGQRLKDGFKCQVCDREYELNADRLMEKNR